MPYREMWVEEYQLTDDEEKAVRALISAALRVSNRLWPHDDAVLLDSAAQHVMRVFLFEKDPEFAGTMFPVDEKYKAWLSSKKEQA